MAESRFITMPGPQVAVCPFSTYLTFIVDNEPRFQHPTSRVRQGIRILDALEKATQGVLELRVEDWELLRQIVDAPECGHSPQFMKDGAEKIRLPARLFIPFVDAINAAVIADPRLDTHTAKAAE